MMQANLGYLFYKDIYKVKDNQLVTNIETKSNLLNREMTEEEKQPLLKTNSSFTLLTTYPGFTTGTGMPHGIKNNEEDFKIGFYFDHTTGLPIIPGSSVKGVLRSVFPDLKTVDGKLIYKNEIDIVKTKWIQAQIENIGDTNFLKNHFNPLDNITVEQKNNIFKLTIEIFEGIKDNSKTLPKEKYHSIYHRDIFHDAVIIKAGKNNKILGSDYITPHANVEKDLSYEENLLRNPRPLAFLKVLPEVGFQFNFDLKDGILNATQKELLFKKILLTVGVGAKTNVGYGQFK